MRLDGLPHRAVIRPGEIGPRSEAAARGRVGGPVVERGVLCGARDGLGPAAVVTHAIEGARDVDARIVPHARERVHRSAHPVAHRVPAPPAPPREILRDDGPAVERCRGEDPARVHPPAVERQRVHGPVEGPGGPPGCAVPPRDAVGVGATRRGEPPADVEVVPCVAAAGMPRGGLAGLADGEERVGVAARDARPERRPLPGGGVVDGHAREARGRDREAVKPRADEEERAERSERDHDARQPLLPQTRHRAPHPALFIPQRQPP
ncbi:hypothetical protein T484DRAFT_1928278 [Baffinella frigidus]|nr:hypothetical protein T484DRAFT_1928278 [Cryptophyta sp. CCMP2293]